MSEAGREDSLTAALCQAGLPISWLEILEDEALSIELLRDMGEKNLAGNLEELGLSAGEATRLTAAILTPQSTIVLAPPSTANARVVAIQQELFCEDVPAPADAATMTDDALRAFFEAGGFMSSSPTVSPGWRVMQPDTPPQPASSSSGSAAWSPPTGAIVGSLPLKWAGHEATFEYAADSTVLDLQVFIRHKTDVPIGRMKLLGWLPVDKRAAELRSTRLVDLRLGPRSSKLIVMGTPQADAARAEADLERAKRAQRFIASDLKPPPPTATEVAARMEEQRQMRGAARGHDNRPIHANRGGGIFLDPSVWAVSEEEDTRRRRARGTHVLNPATNRLERLDLGTALLGAGAGGHLDANPLAPPPRVDEQPDNLDLLGQARGGIAGVCDGYVRRPPENAENENDTTILNCARCGRPCTEHEAL